MTTKILAVGFGLLAVACVDNRPSTGRCTGTIASVAIDEPIVPAQSYFYRDDDILGDEDAPIAMAYGTRVIVDAELADMPDKTLIGTFPSTDAKFHRWAHTEDGGSTSAESITFTTAHRERLVGQFVSGAMTCTFDLRRAYEKDTHD